MEEGILKIEKISFSYKNLPVLKDISFEIKRGEFFGIVGPNGSGKTTLLKIMDGILKPEEGEVYYGKTTIHKLARKEIARRISYVPQEHELPFAFTVEETVLMGRYSHLGILGIEGKRDREIAKIAMEKCKVFHLRERIVTEISGGEKQRVVIARALAQEAEVMLLDEPTAHLDLSSAIEIMNLLKNLQEKEKKTVVIASHDLNLLSNFSNRIMLIAEGRIISIDVPSRILTEDVLKRVYGNMLTVVKVGNTSFVVPKILEVHGKNTV